MLFKLLVYVIIVGTVKPKQGPVKGVVRRGDPKRRSYEENLRGGPTRRSKEEVLQRDPERTDREVFEDKRS